tara:strand:- start:458 stop:766 length:309 start_codon:yes stop_codon:yes gene_type:complete
MQADLFMQPYPVAPGTYNQPTSIQAAADMQPKASRLRGLCLDALIDYGNMTPDETAAFLGLDKLSIRPRFSELKTMGEIVDTGERRSNDSGKKAIVWTISNT